jgi:hypothetical protein
MPQPDSTIDPRGPRFAAWVTTAVLVIVLVTGSGVLLAAQAIVFRPCARRGLPQRRVRLVPGLRDLPPVAAAVAQPTGTPWRSVTAGGGIRSARSAR